MTQESKPIDEMTREELRVAVAEEVFGCSVVHEDPEMAPACGCGTYMHTGPHNKEIEHYDADDGWWSEHRLPDYPGDIAAAWAVVEKLKDHFGVIHGISIYFNPNFHTDDGEHPGQWVVGWKRSCVGSHVATHQPLGTSTVSVEEAICRAALRAVRDSDNPATSGPPAGKT